MEVLNTSYVAIFTFLNKKNLLSFQVLASELQFTDAGSDVLGIKYFI
jgi:hypothetical protein